MLLALELDAIAARMKAYLEERLGVSVPIVKEAIEGPCIVRELVGSGDIYSGGTYVSALTFDGELRIRFEMTEHDLSGQCDSWTLEVTGAREGERARLADVFHPRQRTGWWNDHARVEYTFDGVRGGF